MTLPRHLWRLGASLAAPLLPWHFARRVRRGKEVADRLGERRGQGAARPVGPLLWLHAASVGETVAAIPLLEACAARLPALRLLVTTGTVTAADLLGQRWPPALADRLTHRFVPLDVPAFVARFLDGWRPDLGVFVESELWPNLLAACRERGLPLALVNARIGPTSFLRWRCLPGFARETLSSFALVLARSEEDRARFAALGASHAQVAGDLKAAAPPLPVDEAALARLRESIGDRPVFLAASTHPGEDELAIAAHAILVAAFPDLLTVLVPRHPDRGAAVAQLAVAAGLVTARRGDGGAPAPAVAIYVADTLGELGLFYRLAGVALVGGSLVPHGGQNPLEAARLGCPILLGPHSFNFAEPVARLLQAGAARRVIGPQAASLAEAAHGVLSDATAAAAMAVAGSGIAAGEAGLPDRLAVALLALLPATPGAEKRCEPVEA